MKLLRDLRAIEGPSMATLPIPPVAATTAVGVGALIGLMAVWITPLGALALSVSGTLLFMVLREPRIGLYGLITLAYLLPFAIIPVRLGFQLTGLEAIVGLTLAVVIVRALAHHTRPAWRTVLFLFAAYVLVALLSYLVSLPYAGPFTEVGRKFGNLLLALALFPLTLSLIRGDCSIEGMLRAIIIVGLVEALVAVGLTLSSRDMQVQLLSALGPVGYPTGDSVLRYLPGPNDTYSDTLRATGTSIDPNALGGALVLAAALGCGQLFSQRPVLPRLFLVAALSLTAAAMLLSQSRASWVGLTVAVLVLAVLRWRRIWLAVVGFAALASVAPVGRSILGRVLSGFGGQDKAAAMRLDEYRNAIEIIRQHPLLGIGFGRAPAIDLAPGVSSQLLTVGETVGLFGLAIYCIVVGWLLLRAARLLLSGCEPPRRQGIVVSLLAAFVAALTTGLFDHYFSSTAFPHMVALFWLLAALIWQASQGSRAPSNPREV